MTKKYDHIYVARGIGILLVLIGHVVSQDSYIGETIYSFHMPLFFMLSGIFSGTCEKYKFFPYFKKTLKQTILPYVVFALFGVFLNFIIPEWRVNLTKENFLDALLNCNEYYWFTTGALWFLVALFEVKLIFYFYHKAVLKHDDRLIHFFSIIVWFFIAIYAAVLEQRCGFTFHFQIKSALMGTPFYMMGYLFRENIKSFSMGKGNGRNWMLLVICLTLTLGFAARYNGNVNLGGNWYHDSYLYILFSISGSFGAIALASLLRKSKLLRFLGENSMIIYLVHLSYQHLYTYVAEKGFGIIIDGFSLNYRNSIRLITVIIASSLTALIVSKLKSAIISKRTPKLTEQNTEL